MNKSIYEITTPMEKKEVFHALQKVSVEKAKMLTSSHYVGKVTPDQFKVQVIAQEGLKVKGQIKTGNPGSVIRFEILHPSKMNLQIALLNGLLLPIMIGIGIWIMIISSFSGFIFFYIIICALIYLGLHSFFKFIESKPDVDSEARYLEKLFQGDLKVLEEPQAFRNEKLEASTEKS